MDAVEHICPIAWGRIQRSALCWIVIAYCEHHIDERRSVHCFRSCIDKI